MAISVVNSKSWIFYIFNNHVHFSLCEFIMIITFHFMTSVNTFLLIISTPNKRIRMVWGHRWYTYLYTGS